MSTQQDRGRARGRGRMTAIPEKNDEIGRPGDIAGAIQSTAALSSQTLISGTGYVHSTSPSLIPSETITESDAANPEKFRRGGAPTIMQSAPRGKGVEHLIGEFAQMSVHSLGRSSSRSIPWSDLPRTRPESCIDKRGTSGDVIPLIANYIKILSAPTWELFQYHIGFKPDIIEQRKMRRELIIQHRECIKDVAFDGTTMYSFDDLGDEKLFHSRHPVTNENIDIILRKTAKSSPESPNFFHLANLIVRKLLQISGMKMIGRNYYQFDRKIELERYRLTLFPGFMTNVNVYEGSLMINVDLSHKVINKTTIYQRLQDIFNQTNDIKRAQDIATKELVGQIVLTTYNSKTYKLDEIAWDKDPKFAFKKRDGREQSLVQYYNERYRLQISDEAQPLLLSKPSKRDRRAGITGPIMFMREMAQHTHVDPMIRYARLNEFIHDIYDNKEAQKELEKWNINLCDNLVEFEARILDNEQILYNDRAIQYKSEEADWSREGRAMKHINAKNLNNWILVYPLKEQVTEFIYSLRHVCQPMGMNVESPDTVQLPNDRSETYLDALTAKVKKNTDLVLCILPNDRKDRYDAIKKYLCLDNPVPSQMVLSKTLSKRGQLMSVATKIGIQLNAKLGGEIWGVNIPSKTLMIIGIDSYHDSRHKDVSVGAFVASVNPSCTRYYSQIIYQRTTQELMDGLARCIRDSLSEFHRVNNALPEKIVLYRDGVSDGQLAVVAEHELPQIVSTFPKIMPGYEPKLAVVIIKKRGNARFFARNGRNIINPPPGTIIDHTVTNSDWYDFYLISQCARQGTVAPTHYNVIWDRTNLK
ncbi:unnamed protein product, partial [Didymodactylos carnosus]